MMFSHKNRVLFWGGFAALLVLLSLAVISCDQPTDEPPPAPSLPAPSNLTAYYRAASKTVELSFTVVDGADGYVVYRKSTIDDDYAMVGYSFSIPVYANLPTSRPWSLPPEAEWSPPTHAQQGGAGTWDYAVSAYWGSTEGPKSAPARITITSGQL